MDMRYQQGIGVPQTLGVQPTVWKEPQMVTPKAFSFTASNAGTSRDYGDPGPYVDTKPSRWGTQSADRTTAREARLGVQGLGQILSKRGSGEETITTDSGSRTMTRPATGVVDPAERRDAWGAP